MGTRNILVNHANSPGNRRVFYITDTGRERPYLLKRGRGACIAFLRNLVMVNFFS